MRKAHLLLIFALVVSLLPLQAGANANATDEMASTIATTHMSVYLVFPTSAYPGQTVTISATTTAKSSGTVVSFSIDVFALIDGKLMKIGSQTIVANAYVTVGEEWRSLVVVAIPADAQNALLTGTITEVWQQAPSYYSSYCVTPYYSMPHYAQNYQFYHYSAQQRMRMPLRQAPAPETVRLFNGVVAPVSSRLPNGVVVVQTSPETSSVFNPQINGLQVRPSVDVNVHERSYVSFPATYYVPSHVSSYPPDCFPDYPVYPKQVISQQTFALTYILG